MNKPSTYRSLAKALAVIAVVLFVLYIVIQMYQANWWIAIDRPGDPIGAWLLTALFFLVTGIASPTAAVLSGIGAFVFIRLAAAHEYAAVSKSVTKGSAVVNEPATNPSAS
ncbi:hypothetical protein SAMN05421878_11348 [Actinobaculum suis]|uniref:Uncharacterized protein n=1 Tax=Actinobaculum suis TaxID=1657 RepID=A0A0K9ERK8_9ACTO|nr:hypothetical protein [Actinobaculum suis]KMY22828.1 hypothetical protein ACU19_07890 [Actinobaculum suis]MDY5152899.1 hypothetical protein [Actinobaculum suis]OCA94805.1 hypothetical protein ACU21_05630 [Actinobaculum suis]SDE55849.1 hypothetical protein SAMN05421878_11348 [Actinobaculum suis]VDG77166.1 Uncharacterised protein [Actinobaculum suis]